MNGKHPTISTLKRLLLTLGTLAAFTSAAFAADKSVIIGFAENDSNDMPGMPGMEAVEVDLGPNTKVYYRYQLIPAVAATMPEEEIEALRQNPGIAYVEENGIYTATATLDDGAEEDYSWQVPHLFADRAHASGNLGTGVKIAVLDTGIDYMHEDLDANYRGGIDFVHGDDTPLDDSYNSHGTHVAGIIAAERNGVGVVGIAPEAELYAVKVLDGSTAGTAAWIIAGIEWAVLHEAGIDIINMSLAGGHSEALRAACDAARDAGVLVVASAGNYLNGGGPVKYPAAYRSVIAVTATDRNNEPGYLAPIGGELELAAPGMDILSTAANDDYRSLNGTSQAAACVSGAAALYFDSLTIDLNNDEEVDHKDVRLMLKLTARDLGPAGRDELFGCGLVDTLETSFEHATTLSITETRGDDTRHAVVEDGLYCITVANYHLWYLGVSVYEGGVYREDLSSFIYLRRGYGKNTLLWLDATGTSYTVYFTPYGAPGLHADIVIEREPE